jgi:hypothetical protein
MREIEEKLNQIYECISIKKSSELDSGLISGDWGEILFLVQYLNKNNSENIYIIFEEKLKNILANELQCNDISFADGLAGIGWCICHLVKKGIIDEEDFEELLIEIDTAIEKHLDIYDREKKFDYLYGLVGIGNYFLERNNTIVVNSIIIKLKNWSTNSIDGCNWTCEMNIRGNITEVYDLCLAHGVSSILIFLSKCIDQGIAINESSSLLRSATQFYMRQKYYVKSNEVYPDYIEFNSKIHAKSNRLAWCYGDLSRSLALYKTGMALNDEAIKEEAIQLCLKLTNSLLENQPLVLDAGICHGSAGIAQIYNRMYHYTKIKEFKESANYWVKITLNFSKFENGLAGFKTSDDENIWVNDYSLLGGISGIGLVLLGFLSDDIEDLSWDRCLLLS